MSIVKYDGWLHINANDMSLYLDLEYSKQNHLITKLTQLIMANSCYDDLGFGIGDEPGDGVHNKENYIRRKGDYVIICVREMCAGLEVKIHKSSLMTALGNIIDKHTSGKNDPGS